MISLPANSYPTATTVDFDPFAGGEVLLTAPATASQKEIWASVRMGDDANCAYNESQSLRLRGDLDVEAMREALQKLVQRHEALRTTFSPDGTHLCIVADLEMDIPLLDLSGLNSQEQQHKVNYLRSSAVEQPFDLEHGPLFRVQILRLQQSEHLLILTVHHIICDGWSWAVLMPELGTLYSALKQGTEPELEEPDRFSDYALMLEKEAASEEARATEEYWLKQFANSIPMWDFPCDRPRPPLRTFNSAREDWELTPTLVRDLKQLGTKYGCSFMTTILAGFEVFLTRLTGQTDAIVGIPAAGQAATGQYNLVGHCVNLLPLRSQVDPQQPFSDYLKSRKTTVLDAYDHQQFTFGSLIQKLSIPRDPSRIPLVSILFNIDQGLDSGKLPFDGLEVEFFSNPRSSENFELFINATELGGKLTLECQYNTNLFDAETIRCRMAEFETLLSGIVANPDSSIATLPLLSETEQQLLAKWNQTETPFPKTQCIHQLVEAQVALTPDAVAVIFEDHSLTYRELNQRANQLAHYLHTLGVKPEVLVGLYVERSLEMVVGVLAILKAGGAYVPLDPAYPQERLAFMLQDSQVSVVLTQENLKANLPNQASIVCLDSDWGAISTSSNVQQLQSPESGVNPNNLAYIIYTSGSTGNPKGVQIEHRSAVNLLNAVRQQPGLTAQDTLLSVTTLSFDIAVSEVFLPLIVGARLVLVSREIAADGIQLLNAIAAFGATFMQPTPATWRLLLATGWQGSLRMKMVSTGEALPRDLAEQLLPRGAGLWNLYGPTETTIWSTGCKVESGRPIYIGRPIDNTQVYILDTHLQPVPIGIPGELYIGGAGLARGYLNRPELTAQKFIFNSSGVRLYKTGDLARFLPDGQIECLGRIDYQVKVRGFRIELGEIETILLQHPAVKEAVAIAREDVPGEKTLVGYFVPHSVGVDTNQLIPELRSFLKERLPDYMVPTIFMALEAMPLTPNGKVDRKALPKPDTFRPELAANYVAPRTALEQQIAQIWAISLNLEQIGIHDNFFEAGGYSLLAIQAISRMRKALEIEILLSNLFERPTVAELANWVEGLRWASQKMQIPSDTSDDYEEGEL